MSQNLRAIYAVSCPGNAGGCIVIDAPDLSLTGPFALSVAVTFMITDGGASGELVRVGDALVLGLDGGVPVVGGTAFGSHCCDASAATVAAGTWSSLVMTWDVTTLRLFLNGFEVYSRAVAAGGSAEPGQWMVGLIEGYLLDVVADQVAFVDADVLARRYLSDGHPEARALYLDLCRYRPVDLGRGTRAVRLTGACRTVDLVRALVPGASGCAALSGGSEAVDALGGPTWTLYANVYTSVAADPGRMVLVSAGSSGGPGHVALGLCGGTRVPFLEVGDVALEGPSGLAESCWHALVATYDGARVRLYVNGALVSSAAATAAPLGGASDFVVGNERTASGLASGFSGCIDSIAVFDRALSSGEVAALTDVPPFVFDAGARSVCLFSGPVPLDAVSMTALSLEGGATCAYVRNTMPTETLPDFTYRPPASDAAAVPWEVGVASDLLFEAGEAAFGIKPTSCVTAELEPIEAAASVIERTLLRNAAVKELVHSGVASVEAVSSVLTAPELAMSLPTVIEVFYLPAEVGVAMKLMLALESMWGGMNSTEVLSCVAVGTLLLTAVSAHVGSWISDHPSSDPDDERDDGGVTLRMASIAFYSEENAGAGAVALRPSFSAEQEGPEWRRGEKSADVAYRRVPAGTHPTLRVELEVTDVDEPRTISFGAGAYGEGSVLGGLDPQSREVSGPGTLTFDFPLSHHGLADAALGAHEASLQWYADDVVLGATHHTVHVLAAAPLAPWSTTGTDGEKLALPALVWAEAVAGRMGGDAGACEFCSAFVGWLHEESGFSGAALGTASARATWGEDRDTLQLDLEGLCSDPGGQLGALDCSCLGAVLAAAEGLPGADVRILSPLAGTGTLWFREVIPFNAAGEPASFSPTEHYVLGVSGDDGLLAYDAYLLTAGDGGQTVAPVGLGCKTATDSPSYVTDDDGYAGSMCGTGSTCFASGSCAVSLGTTPVGADADGASSASSSGLGTIIAGDPILAESPGRPPFDERVIDEWLPLDPVLVRCHSISYKSIERIIVRVVNSCTGSSSSTGRMLRDLWELWRAVNVNDSCDEMGLPVVASGDDEMLAASYEALLSFQADVLESEEEDEIDCVKHAASIASLLNSAPLNLRRGMSDWNAALQDCFDPRKWVHVATINKQLVVDCSFDGSGLDAPPGDYFGLTVQAPGFYLTDETDCTKLRHLSKIASADVRQCVQFRTAYVAGSNNGRHFGDRRRLLMYSSSNGEAVSNCSLVNSPDAVVWYFDSDANRARIWPRASSDAIAPA